MTRAGSRPTVLLLLKILCSVLLLSVSFAFLVTVSTNAPLPYDTNAGTPSFANSGATGPEFPNPQMANDYFAFKARNSDCAGWLAIPNLCYYPVMYSGDNDYYLHHNSMKQTSIGGALFVDMHSRGDFHNICVIYGHHMKNGTMFGSLKKYRDAGFFQNNGPLELFDGQTLSFYKPFTVMLFTDGVDAIDITKTGADKAAYVEQLGARSLIKSDYQYEDDTDLLFLSTCGHDFKDCRLVVGFYKTDEYPYQ